MKATAHKSAAALFCILFVVSLTVAAHARNSTYRDGAKLWSDTVLKSPAKQRPHINLGFSLSEAGSYDRALREFNAALAIRLDESSYIYNEIGTIYFKTGRLDEAVKVWRTGLFFNANNALLLNNLSVALLEKKQYREALRHAEKAYRLNPLRPDPLNTLGEIYMAKGEYEKATGYFLRAIELEPDSPLRYWNAALSFEKSGRYEDAYLYMSKYLTIEKDEKSRKEAVHFMERLKGKKKG